MTQDEAKTGAKAEPTLYKLSEQVHADLARRFTYHAPKGDQAERYEELRDKAKELAELVCESCPQSRELSLSLTHLEQAIFWANAGIARNE